MKSSMVFVSMLTLLTLVSCCLPITPELGQVIHECLWGMNSYYDWPTIGQVYLHVGYRQIYSVRYEILESFAKQRGISF